MYYEDIISELEKVIQFYRIANKTFLPSYQSQVEAVADVESIIDGLRKNDNGALDRLSFLFATTSSIREIAKNNNWNCEFDEISKKINLAIGKIRISQKNDPALYSKNKDGKYTDSNSYASCSGRLEISDDKWAQIKELYKLNFFQRFILNSKRKKVQEFICFGDTQPALVMSVQPLIIAAFSDEMDAVVLLNFMQEYKEIYNLKKYDRLITVNTYSYKKNYNDIVLGPKYLKRYLDFQPNIGDFLSSENDKIKNHKENIPEAIWFHVKMLGEQYLARPSKSERKGFWFI